jgi:uncharacterized membrane protein HdeD (DUF308 family)
MVTAIFGIVRVLAGLLGALWVASGVVGMIYAATDHAWGPALGAVLIAVLGCCLAYSAFVRAPWEPRVGTVDRAS